MESLAVAAAIVFLSVLSSGPLAYLATNNGYVYVGAILGLAAITIGLWFAGVMHMGIGWVGLVSAALGAWSVLQACRDERPE